ncbi:MAG: hypothetical protein N3B21_03640 [Clostridia bacterium]|nr:hypothetical protein [Clostridia bacterium]
MMMSDCCENCCHCEEKEENAMLCTKKNECVDPKSCCDDFQCDCDCACE